MHRLHDSGISTTLDDDLAASIWVFSVRPSKAEEYPMQYKLFRASWYSAPLTCSQPQSGLGFRHASHKTSFGILNIESSKAEQFSTPLIRLRPGYLSRLPNHGADRRCNAFPKKGPIEVSLARSSKPQDISMNGDRGGDWELSQETVPGL